MCRGVTPKEKKFGTQKIPGVTEKHEISEILVISVNKFNFVKR
jgi:hypothetical protein